MITLIYVLILHCLGDFRFQTRYMAANKSKCLKALGLHVGVYSLIFLVGLMFFFNTLAVLAFVVLNAVTHFAIDYVTSKINSKLLGTDQFWHMIGLDQLLHQITLILLCFGLLL